MPGILSSARPQGDDSAPGQQPTGAPPVGATGNITTASPSSAPLSTRPNDPSAAQPSDDGSDEGDRAPNVSPEEQQAYDTFVENGMDLIYGQQGQNGEPDPAGHDGKGARPDILNRLKEASDPIENLANTSVWLVTNLETSAAQAKAPWTQDDDMRSDIVMHGGQALMEELADVSQAAGIHDYSDKEMQGSWYKALDLYRETATQSGQLNADSLKQQFGDIQKADQQGQLGQLLPGIDKLKGEQQDQSVEQGNQGA